MYTFSVSLLIISFTNSSPRDSHYRCVMVTIRSTYLLCTILIIISTAFLYQYPSSVLYSIGHTTALLESEENRAAERFITQLQHPQDCESARKFLCPLTPACGFGCITHKLVDCFIYAAWTNRTVILDPSPGPIIRKDDWEKFFLPISENCTSWSDAVEWDANHTQHQVVKLSPHYGYPTPELAEWLNIPPSWTPAPSSVASPMAWWVGHILQHIYRLQPGMVEHVQAAKQKIGFVEPLAGLQVRRTDKKGEAPYQEVEKYMPWVERYYGNASSGTVKRVFIATDEPRVVTELQTKYPDYIFLSDGDTVSLANDKSFGSRWSREAHTGIITDIQLLMSCQFVACTLSSNICRLIYEIQSSRLWDTARTFHTVDDEYRFM